MLPFELVPASVQRQGKEYGYATVSAPATAGHAARILAKGIGYRVR
ncbi:MAG: hypothetical protein H0X24_04275 [Ktedonobacterales bacterium]|nr:hypothetical protein [Ktedonobacterales bacterium]